MFVNVRFVFFLVILVILGTSYALVELPRVEDNDILNTESVIRSTTNKLFSNINLKGVKQNPKLKQYGLIHNYFVSLSLKDYKNLKEIARLTRVDKKTINNSSENFIDLINEILNEDSSGFESKSKARGDTFGNEVGHYIDDYSHNVAYLKVKYGDKSPRVDINKDIINILQNDEYYLNQTAQRYQESNTTSEDNELLDDNDFWVPDSKFRRIYQAKRSKIKYFPFMASVQFFNNFQCGGSIIKNDLVITAASCLQLAWNNRLFRENPSFLGVRIGSNYYEGGGEIISVLEIYFHPAYNPKNLKNNLAILRLTRKIRFKVRRVSRVKKINFDRIDSPLPMDTNGITIIGWGAKTRSNMINDPWQNKISFSILDVYSLQDCQDTYSKEYVTYTNFCAGKVSKGSGACNKDVGDPGLVHGILTGVVSFGSPVCGTADAPTVFTKVGYFADWIEGILEQESNIPQGKRLPTQKPLERFTLPDISTNTTPTTKPEPTWTTPITPSHPVIPIYNISIHVSSPLYPGFKIHGGQSNMFKQYLKTMFKSKEIDEYIDLNDDKEAALNNADVIAARQEQFAQDAPYLYDTPSTPQLPKHKHVDEFDKFTTPLTDILYNDYNPHTAVDHVTKLDEARVYKAESQENILADINKLDNDIKIYDNIKLDDDKLNDDNNLMLNKHIKSNNDFNIKLNSDINIENDDKIHDEIQLGNALNVKLDNYDQVVNYNKIVSSIESYEIKLNQSEEMEARKELENNILKLIHTIDLKEKIEEVAKKLERKEIKKMIANKKADEDIDDSILALLYVSDSEKRRDGAEKSIYDNPNISPEVRAEDDDIKEFIDKESDNDNSNSNINDIEKELDITQESQQENDLQNGNTMFDEKKADTKNNNFTKTNNAIGLNNFFSKQVLFDILTDMIDYQNKNNTIQV